MKTIAAFFSGRDNNFNLIRFVAASMVILIHSYVLIGRPWSDAPLPLLRDIDLGRVAVEIFFVTSGFLISMSFMRQRNAWHYLEARVLRIFPALIGAVLFNALLVGPLFTTIPLKSYFLQLGPYKYILVNTTLIIKGFQLEYSLPGVFTGNPYTSAVNGSLWTLPFEIWWYIFLMIIGLTGLLDHRKAFNLLFALALAGDLLAFALLKETALFVKLSPHLRLGIFFLAGIFYYVNRNQIPVNLYLLLAMLAAGFLLRHDPVLQRLFHRMTLSYGVMWFAFVPSGWIRTFNNLGDYSYGLYIYAYPIQQSLVALSPGIRPASMLALSFSISLLVAILSWTFIEKPALQRKGSSYPYLFLRAQRIPWLRRLVDTHSLDVSTSE